MTISLSADFIVPSAYIILIFITNFHELRYVCVGFASIEVFPSQNSQVYLSICPTVPLISKSIGFPTIPDDTLVFNTIRFGVSFNTIFLEVSSFIPSSRIVVNVIIYVPGKLY